MVIFLDHIHKILVIFIFLKNSTGKNNNDLVSSKSNSNIRGLKNELDYTKKIEKNKQDSSFNVSGGYGLNNNYRTNEVFFFIFILIFSRKILIA